jgi:hypothetical protein
MSDAPAIYVLSTDPARRPIAFVSESEPCRHDAAVDVGIAKWCSSCGALARWHLGAGGNELRWQMPGRGR